MPKQPVNLSSTHSGRRVMNEGSLSVSTSAAKLPRYTEVANDLINRIASGRYPVHSLLPKEVDLSVQYGISRHTLREALRRLHDAGLVSRRRRAGTEVIAAVPAVRYVQPVNSILDILQYGAETELSVRSICRIRSTTALAALVGGDPGREWICAETVRTRPGDPRLICHTTMYLNSDLDGVEGHIRNLTMPMSAMIEAEYGIVISEIEQTMQAVSLDEAAARLLDVEPGSAALKAVRRFYDRDRRLIELSIALHPGDSFAYSIRLHRQQDAQ
jgi:DNA-binding GntR family transcriptional regulator